ncbi:prephenate dehydrogenase [Aeoliella sp. SH292]|uniref:prephenate dehydrogenase n=1 Tax=Aeoliella sp. SH292 TaxID=3454464 RepID=UPI003F94B592
MPQFEQLSIVGVGLLGGSIALAARERRVAGTIVGIGRSPAKLANLVSQGMLDRVATSLADGVATADLVIVATPVDLVAETVADVRKSAPASCLITDVGSTKHDIVAQVVASSMGSHGQFVGSHPLAGDHRSGAEFSRANLFVGRTVVVTPDASSDAEAVSQICEFWKALGARVVEMSPAEHDQAVALTSHLPHAVASALASATPAEVRQLVATGWSDTTRVAAGDAALWRQIFLANRPQVLAALDQFNQHLALLRAAIEAGDGAKLEQLLAEGKRIRDAVGN